MPQQSEYQRRFAIKSLIIQECDKDVDAELIADDEPLFGDSARLKLDSLDALQLSLALQQQYGVRLTDSKDLRRAFATVATLDSYLQQQS